MTRINGQQSEADSDKRWNQRKEKPVAQRQEMVFGALALLSFVTIKTFKVSRAAAPKGTKSCRTQGESVHPYVHPSVRGWLGAPRD